MYIQHNISHDFYKMCLILSSNTLRKVISDATCNLFLISYLVLSDFDYFM